MVCAFPQPGGGRATAMRRLHAAARKAGLDREARQAVQLRVAGRESAAELNERELNACADEIERVDRQQDRRSRGTVQMTGPYAGKLRFLWIAAWNLGLARNSTDAALMAWVERQTGLSSARWLRDPQDGRAAIEGLKKWIERAGVDWTSRWNGSPQPDGMRIAFAQYRRAHGGEDFETFLAILRAAEGKPVAELTKADWRRIMNEFGPAVRLAVREE